MKENKFLAYLFLIVVWTAVLFIVVSDALKAFDRFQETMIHIKSLEEINNGNR